MDLPRLFFNGEIIKRAGRCTAKQAQQGQALFVLAGITTVV